MESTWEDRIKGVLVGQAAGDALGAGYEFGPGPEYGQAVMREGPMGFEPGEATDDTQQAVIVAQERSVPLFVAGGLLRWFQSGPRDVGASTASVLRRAQSARDVLRLSKAWAAWENAAPKPEGWDPGMANGSLMRTGPVCLPYLNDRAAIARAAREVSDVTHFDLWAGDACVLWSLLIDAAIAKGSDFDLMTELGEALEFIPAASMAGTGEDGPNARREFWRGVMAEALAAPHGGMAANARLAQRRFRQNGSAVGAFKAALWAVSHSHDLRSGLYLAVSIGGDTDTVAAIAGQLLGAMHGASAVPQEWRDMLHVSGVGGVELDVTSLELLALAAAGVNALT